MQPVPAAAGGAHRGESLGLLLLTHVVRGDIVSQIESAIFGFFASIWNGIQSFFGSIFSSFGNLISSIFQAPVGAINQSFATLQGWTSQFGPLSPIITVLIVLFVVLVVFFVFWLVIKLSISEAEQTGEEVEEGV